MELKLQPLTPSERITSRDQARAWIIEDKGKRPDRKDFDRHTASKYPPSVTRTIRLLALIVLIAAFTPSAIRLHEIGSTTFESGVNGAYKTANDAVGITTILLAETGQVVFSLALATFTGSRRAKWFLYFGMAASTVIALVGNIELALIDNLTSPFAWLESIMPPLIVLSTAYVLKEQFLEAIEQRHRDQRAFEEAMNKYLDATRDPDSDPLFRKYFAEAVKLTHTRKRGQVKDARKLKREDWIQIVNREIQEETWYLDIEVEEPPIQEDDTQKVEVLPFEANPFPVNSRQNGDHARNVSV